MAQKTATANPIANFFEAQTIATAEIAQAALNGMQRLQKLTLQAMRAGAGQLSLAQSLATRDGGASRSVSEAAAPVAEQGARYQREIVQAIADMNNDIVRASYSMVERMRDALGATTQGGLTMASALPNLPTGGQSLTNPMAIYDSAVRQWQTTMQELMETPAVALAVASAEESERPRAAGDTPARKSKRSAKRKSGARSR